MATANSELSGREVGSFLTKVICHLFSSLFVSLSECVRAHVCLSLCVCACVCARVCECVHLLQGQTVPPGDESPSSHLFCFVFLCLAFKLPLFFLYLFSLTSFPFLPLSSSPPFPPSLISSPLSSLSPLLVPPLPFPTHVCQ